MKKQTSVLVGLTLVGLLAFAVTAYAANPTFTLTQSGGNFQLNVTADPNQTVTLVYQDVSGGMPSATVSSTDSSGHLAYTFTTSTFNILPGGTVYITTNGGSQQSLAQTWQSSNSNTSTNNSSNNNANLSFDYPNINIPIGSGGVVTIYGGAGYYVSTSTNPSVVSASINGNNLTLTPLSPGTNIVTICSASNGCGTVNVTVGSGSTSAASTTTPVVATTIAQPVITSTSSVLSVIQSMQTQLAQLLAQIQSMNSVLSQLVSSIKGPTGQVAGASITVNTNTPAATFTRTLKVGSEGAEVTTLQNYLAQKGFLSATPNGHFGPATEAALKDYQTSRGLEPVGYVGPSTRAALNAGN